MCTRFHIFDSMEAYREILEEAQESPLLERFRETGRTMLTSGEVRPTDVVAVLASSRGGNVKAFPMRWGFRSPGRSLLVNARVETAAQKPSFRDSWEKHRCAVPAGWYYEWAHTEQGERRRGEKYRIRPEGEGLTWLCGLYRMEEGLPVFTVVTRDPSEELRRIHDRMPLILPEERAREWVLPQTKPETLLPFALTDLTAQKCV